jgi:hypothetical protein
MNRAYILIREAPWYRRDVFCSGLKAAGLEVMLRPPVKPGPDTVLVIWNRYTGNHELACQVEKAGGLVWVAENGYIGAGGGTPKFQVHPGGPQPGHYYSIAEGWHNGRGRAPAGGPERWAALGVTLKPWRTAGEHILVCPNRSFGVGEQVMHPDWGQRCAERLRARTARPVRLRVHPGNSAPPRPLSQDLAGAWAVVVWSSSVAVHALVEGIPAYIEAPYQIVKAAGASGPVDNPVCPERLPVLERLAWQQWTCEEIAKGLPFALLLSAAR